MQIEIALGKTNKLESFADALSESKNRTILNKSSNNIHLYFV